MQANCTKNNDIDDIVERRAYNTKFNTKNQNKYCQAIYFYFRAILITIADIQ